MRWHYFGRLSSRRFLVTGCCLAAVFAGPVEANPLAIVTNIPAHTLVAMSATNMLCIAMTYDENGNRLSQTVASITSTTTTWGTAAYGCFVWKQ